MVLWSNSIRIGTYTLIHLTIKTRITAIKVFFWHPQWLVKQSSLHPHSINFSSWTGTGWSLEVIGIKTPCLTIPSWINRVMWVDPFLYLIIRPQKMIFQCRFGWWKFSHWLHFPQSAYSEIPKCFQIVLRKVFS